MRTGPTNLHLQNLIRELKTLSSKQDSGLWRRLALDLERPTRSRRAVNLSRIAKFTKDNELVVVPGKVLGSGDMPHKITIAAWDFSAQAVEKINKAKGTCMTIQDLVKKNPKPSEVRIIG